MLSFVTHHPVQQFEARNTTKEIGKCTASVGNHLVETLKIAMTLDQPLITMFLSFQPIFQMPDEPGQFTSSFGQQGDLFTETILPSNYHLIL